MITIDGAKTFRQIWPGIPNDQDHVYFRHDWAPARIGMRSSAARPTWTALGPSGARPDIATTGGRGAATVARPAAPGWVEVEDGESLVRIWFVRATVTVRKSGSVSPGNPWWPNIQRYLQALYGNTGYRFTQLGLIQFNSSGQSMADMFTGRRYGGMVEIVGRVEPADVAETGMKFYLARRITGGRVQCVDAQGRPLPPNRDARMRVPPAGSNDTSGGQPGSLTPSGELFDYDLPGAVMRPANLVNDRHTVDVSFEQCVAIGAPPTAAGAQDPWPRIAADGLAVSPLVRWRAHYSATMQRACSLNPEMQIRLEGSVG